MNVLPLSIDMEFPTTLISSTLHPTIKCIDLMVFQNNQWKGLKSEDNLTDYIQHERW